MNKLEFFPDFEDVLIRPEMSELDSRQSVDLRFKMNGWNPIPIMSANMDTVTDINSAFELLKYNWIPVLHKYVSIEDISKLFDMIKSYNNKILLRNDDANDRDKDINIVYYNQKIYEYNQKTYVKKHFLIDPKNVFISRGTSDTDKEKLEERLNSEPRIQSFCIDVANGHRISILSYLKELKEKYPDKILMAGNIVTSEAAILYAKAGVDIMKCGIGQGSVCTTRIKTGVGIPQIGMVLEIKSGLKNEIIKIENDLDFGRYHSSELAKINKELENLNRIMLCADGGIKISADIAKAFVAGADFVMLGGMLSGHKESPGKIELLDGKKVKRLSGMASKISQQSGVPTYGVEEGKTVFIPYKGKLKYTIQDIEGGLNSTATYINAKNICDFSKAQLIRTNIQENRVYS